MPFKRRFKDKYAVSSPENASVVRTLFDLFHREKSKTAPSRSSSHLCLKKSDDEFPTHICRGFTKVS